jgi:hypothetical protein
MTVHGQSESSWEYGMKHGHPPVADRVVCVDFDGTIAPWGGLMDMDKVPLPGAAQAMRDLKAAGYHIYIFTSRLSEKWLASEGLDAYDQFHYVRDWLRKYDIPFSYITGEKVPALCYIDDKAVRVSEGYPLAAAIADFLDQ